MKYLNAETITELLEAPMEDRRPLVRRIQANASVSELMTTLRKSNTPLVRLLVCDMLGRRHEKAAVPVLIATLEDESPDVRASAAEALAKIGDVRAGEALLQHLADTTEDIGVKRVAVAALAAVGYRPAIPVLIQALADRDDALRGLAAGSLGALKAKEAKDSLERAVAIERNAYAIERLRHALNELNRPSRKRNRVKHRSSNKA